MPSSGTVKSAAPSYTAPTTPARIFRRNYRSTSGPSCQTRNYGPVRIAVRSWLPIAGSCSAVDENSDRVPIMTAPSTGDPLNSPRFGRELLAFVTGSLLRVAEQAGLDGNDLLASAGLSREQLKSPDAYLPVEKHIALGMRMTEMLGSVNAGLHSGAAIYGDPSGALGFAIRRSRNHATALTRF